MSAIFNKLNLKRQTEILVLNAPESFEPELAALVNVTIRRNAQDVREIAFALAFVTKQKEVDVIARTVARKATGDAIVWFAYPKGTSTFPPKDSPLIASLRAWVERNLASMSLRGDNLLAIERICLYNAH